MVASTTKQNDGHTNQNVASECGRKKKSTIKFVGIKKEKKQLKMGAGGGKKERKEKNKNKQEEK